MTVSFRSKGFQDLYTEVDKEYQAGNIKSYEDIDKLVKESDSDILTEEFMDANRKFDAAAKAGETDFRAAQLSDEDLYGPDKLAESLVRTAGRGAGEIGRGLEEFSETFLPENVNNAFEKIADGIGEYVPESVKEAANELFDPYHGEGAVAAAEEIAGTIGSFLVGGGALIKGANAGYKGAKLASPGMRSIVTKTARKAGRRPRSLTKTAGKGTAYAAAATVLAPEDNLANVIMEVAPEFESGKEFLDNNPKFTAAVKKLALNPDDKGSEKYLKTFLANMGLAGAISPFYLASAFRKPIGEAATVAFAPLGKLKESLPDFNYLPASFSSRMGTDDETLGFIVERAGASKAAIGRAEADALDLKETLQREYGFTSSPRLKETLDKALRGDKDALAGLKEDTRAAVTSMRQNVDTLSKEVAGDAKGELAAKIGDGMGVYLTRSYDYFDNPEYTKKIQKQWKKYRASGQRNDPDGVFASALQAIKESGAKDPEAVLKRIIDKRQGDEGISDVLGSLVKKQGGTQSAKSGMKRDESLPSSIRTLLGEVDDPMENYVKTMANLSEITAQQRFTKDIANHLVKKGLATADSMDPKKSVLLADAADEKLGMIFGGKAASQLDNPLQGLYVTPAYQKAIKEGLELTDPAGPVAKIFMRAKGVSQVAKTVYSPVTHGRNVMGNTFMLLANGMLPGTKAKDAASAIMPKKTVKKLRGLSNRALADKYARYVELGLANSGIGINLVRRNLSAFDSAPEKWLEKTALGVPKKLNKTVMDAYQAEDDFFKIAHFEKTLDYVKKSKKYRKLPLKEQERIAAQRTRDLMPNYNLVPKALKKLRGYPVGDFLSFPAEMTRISKNLMKYTIDDITSGDATLVAEGAKRAAGLTAVTAGIDGLVDLGMNMAGITEEQDAAINNTVAPWEFNQDRIYLSGIDEDERGHKGVDYISLGPIDPFAYIKTAAKGVHEIINVGDTSKTDTEAGKLALNTFRSIVSPYAAPSMITEAMIDMLDTRRITDETEYSDQVIAALEPLTGLFTPAILTEITKRQEYDKSLQKNQGEYAEKAGLYNWPEGEVDTPAFFGMKRQRLDLTAGTNFAVRPLLQEIDGVGNTLKELLRNPNLTQEDVPEIRSRYMNAQKQRLGGYEKLRSLLQDYKTLYGDGYEQELQKGITLDQMGQLSANMDNHLNNAMYVDPRTGEDVGYFEPFVLRRQDIQGRMNTPIPWDDLSNIYNTLNGTTIEQQDD